MVDYMKMKNADLESLLKERGLPHTGKKADMVQRLTDDDAKKTATTGAIATENEDEIDWDDDAAEAPAPAPAAESVKPVTAALTAAATETKVDGNNPQAVPNQAASIDPSTTEDLSTKAPATDTNSTDTFKASENGSAPPEKKPEVDFSTGLEQTDVDKEIEKRKKRAERFQIKTGEEDPAAVEALQKLVRANKFKDDKAAIENAPVKGLDQALPERREKRRREGGDDRGDFKRGGRGGRRFNGARGFHDRRAPRDDRSGNREPRQERSGGGSWMNEDDRKRAADRAARFSSKV